MRFITTLCAILFALSATAANLLTNGDFNGKDMYADFVYKSTHGQLKLTDFTEDMTWNKCLKVELVKLRELKDGTKLLTCDLISGMAARGLGRTVCRSLTSGLPGCSP